MKKIIAIMAILFVSIGLFNSSSNANAQENDSLTEEEFKELKEQGLYGEDITYEQAKKLLESPDLDSSKNGDDSQTFSAKAAYSPRAGDIVLTSDTSAGGFTGHAGIVLTNGNILHYPSPKESIKQYTFNQWKSRYPHTRVMRPNATIGKEAAVWAQKNYWDTNRNADYSINFSIYQKDPTYCSKIVWQAFYYGTGSKKVMGVPVEHIIAPFEIAPKFYPGYYPTEVYDTI